MMDLPAVVSGTSFPRKRESRFRISASGGFRNDIFATSELVHFELSRFCLCRTKEVPYWDRRRKHLVLISHFQLEGAACGVIGKRSAWPLTIYYSGGLCMPVFDKKTLQISPVFMQTIVTTDEKAPNLSFNPPSSKNDSNYKTTMVESAERYCMYGDSYIRN